MTVSSSSTVEFDISKVAKLAYQMAGIVSVYSGLTTQQATHAQDLLELITKTAQTFGMMARTAQLYNLTLTASVSAYTLPQSILDVLEDGAFIDPSQNVNAASGETPVRAISRETWQGLSAKDATGRPTLYFPDRTADALVLNIWPTPDAQNAGTIRLQTHRLRADVIDGSATLDFEVYWTEYFVAELGARLALSHSMSGERVSMLKREAADKLEKCRAYSNQHVDQQFVLSHRVSGNRR